MLAHSSLSTPTCVLTESTLPRGSGLSGLDSASGGVSYRTTALFTRTTAGLVVPGLENAMQGGD